MQHTVTYRTTLPAPPLSPNNPVEHGQHLTGRGLQLLSGGRIVRVKHLTVENSDPSNSPTSRTQCTSGVLSKGPVLTGAHRAAAKGPERFSFERRGTDIQSSPKICRRCVYNLQAATWQTQRARFIWQKLVEHCEFPKQARTIASTTWSITGDHRHSNSSLRV